jgi:nucleoside 2-deoxyribosyltransferase
MQKIYIAGQHVFHKDVEKLSNKLKKICEKYHLEGIFPMDNECETADDIFESNLQLLRSADIVVALIEPFRGVSVDPGTAMEIGFAKALDKPVYGHRTNKLEYKDRVETCSTYPHVEDFGLGENLMIEKSCTVIHKTFESCIKDICKSKLKHKVKKTKITS